jgi:hypothetical protein
VKDGGSVKSYTGKISKRAIERELPADNNSKTGLLIVTADALLKAIKEEIDHE